MTIGYSALEALASVRRLRAQSFVDAIEFYSVRDPSMIDARNQGRFASQFTEELLHMATVNKLWEVSKDRQELGTGYTAEVMVMSVEDYQELCTKVNTLVRILEQKELEIRS